MNHLEEIEYRNVLMSRVYKGEKISPKDRLWLETHPVYNWRLGYPYLKADILTLEAKKTYQLHIELENLKYAEQIIPVISVPACKGAIYTDFSIKDFYGNDKTGNPVKALGVTVNADHRSSSFRYRSDIGLLMVTYQCRYYDEKHRMLLSDTSDSASARLAMLKETVSEKKVLYRCKSPVRDDYDSLVFSVAWEPTAECADRGGCSWR